MTKPNKYFYKTLQEEIDLYGSEKMKTIEDMLGNNETSIKDRFELARVFRAGYEAITNKYGTMLDYGFNHPNAEEMNKEIIRRDQLLFRFVKYHTLTLRGEDGYKT